MKNLGNKPRALRYLGYMLMLATTSNMVFALAASKGFNPNTITAGGVSDLVITVRNDDLANATSLNIFDNLAAFGNGIVIASSSLTTQNCGPLAGTLTVGSSIISLSGGTVAAGATCTVTVRVTSNIPNGPAPAGHLNSIAAGQINYTVNGAPVAGNPTSAILTVNPAQPSVSKTFNPSTIQVQATSQLALTISNPNNVPAQNLDAVDVLPAGLIIANASGGNGIVSNNCTPPGSLTAAADTNTISIQNANLAGLASCTVVILVRATTAGPHVNIIPAGPATQANGGVSFDVPQAPGGPLVSVNSAGTSATLQANNNPPTVFKEFVPDFVKDCGCSELVITLSNPALIAATIVSFEDRLPRGLRAAERGETDCVGAHLDVSRSRISLLGGIIPASSSCTIRVPIESKCNGVFTNRIAAGAFVTSTGRNILAAEASVEFCCEDKEHEREMCLVQDTVDDEEDMSLSQED